MEFELNDITHISRNASIGITNGRSWKQYFHHSQCFGKHTRYKITKITKLLQVLKIQKKKETIFDVNIHEFHVRNIRHITNFDRKNYICSLLHDLHQH